MKKINLFLTLLLSAFIFNNAFASFPITKKGKEKTNKIEQVESIEKNELITADAPIAAPSGGDMSWGAFTLGFLLGLIGVLAVFVFGGDTRSAWKGFGAWVLLLVILFGI